ncbi:uncharacterized protein LOC108674387 [Hyalella azteca]|uniref:Uncharacterized protein LOC108674387 n=1 Tax=Hyalella azteca TaxID=294128 RepID=A0A8B7NVN6_HYAAZ|nr:uncharacterized protein LOC108674387 [Hyalella azteca]
MVARASLLLLLLAVSQSPASATDYDVCPNFVDCHCSDDVNSIGIFSDDGALESCLSYLHENKLLRFKKLHLSMANKNLRLTENLLKDIQFDEVFVYRANIVESNENFLGASRETVLDINFFGCKFEVFPRINSSSLVRFVTEETSLLDIPGNAFLTPQLKEIKIQGGTSNLTLNSGAMEPLSHLEQFNLFGVSTVHLATDSFKLSSPTFKIFNSTARMTAESGAFSGFTNGSALIIVDFIGPWTHDVFYDLLSGGATITTLGGQSCQCDMAWIRYSSFLPQMATVRCVSNDFQHPYPLSAETFVECPIADLDQDMLANCF